MKKYILLIALIVVSQANLALASSASPELRLATEQLVVELNKVLDLHPEEKMQRLSELSEEAEALFSQYQAQGISDREQFSIQRCLMFVAKQQQKLLFPSNETVLEESEINSAQLETDGASA